MVYRQADGQSLAQVSPRRVALCAQLDAGDIAQAYDTALIGGLDNHLAKLLGADQAALGLDADLEGLRAVSRRLVHDPGRHLQVLGAQGANHISRGETHGVDQVRVEPDPHRVLTRPQQAHPADAIDSRQRVAQVKYRVIGDVQLVVGFVGRVQVDGHHQVGRIFLRGYPEPAHRLRQARFSDGDTVLYLYLRIIEVGAQGEGDGDAEVAVAGGLGLHVEHVLDAVDLLLQRCRHGIGDHFRARTGVGRPHLHRGRSHFRILGNR